MKCQNCGKNEVTFYYRSEVNGQVEEKHLCAQCAQKLGYQDKMAVRSRKMMDRMLGRDFFGGGLLEDFFSPSFLGGRFLEDPFDDFFADMPALGPVQPQRREADKGNEERLGDEKEQSRFSYLRQVNALRSQMKKAVRQEDFETAAKLRDELHALEQEREKTKE